MSRTARTQRRAGESLPERSRSVSQNLMRDYTDNLGIGNPVHWDPQFAARSEFGTPIASGPISLALVDDVLAGNFPEWLRGGSIKVAFLRPVRAGDRVTARLTLRAVAAAEGGEKLTFDIACLNQEGTIVLGGKATVWLPVRG